MQVVDEVVAPNPARMLVKAHGPKAHHLRFRIGIELRKRLQPIHRDAGKLGNLVKRVIRHELGVGIEIDLGQFAGFGPTGRALLQLMLRPQAITDIGCTAPERRVLVYEVFVHAPCLDDVVRDRVHDRKIGLGCEHDRDVGKIERSVFEG